MNLFNLLILWNYRYFKVQQTPPVDTLTILMYDLKHAKLTSGQRYVPFDFNVRNGFRR